MGITAKQSESNGDFKIVNPGNYIARCYSMVEIGTEETVVKGNKKTLKKVRLTWELPTEKATFSPEKGEQPYMVSKDYTLSMYEKATLRKDLESWRGAPFSEDEAKSFDITKLLGAPCMLNVIHSTSKTNGKTYANISTIASMPKGVKCPDQINASFMLSYEDWDDKKFSTLPDWLKQRMEKTPEFKSRLEGTDEPATDGSDLPF